MVDVKIKKPLSDIEILRVKAQAHGLAIVRNSTEINEGREIPADLIDSMISDGFFRLLVPHSFGGFELDYIDFLNLLDNSGDLFSLMYPVPWKAISFSNL